MKTLLLMAFVVGMLCLAACGATATPAIFDSPLGEPTLAPGTLESPLGLPNPASKFCEDQGYQLEIREQADGSVGYCIFPDGSECEEWAFYRRECAPGTPKP
jgi:putative hemolysin